MSAPQRLVLMRIQNDEDALYVAAAHESLAAIPGVACVAAARRATPRDSDTTFTHVSLFEFDDADTRAAYHVHPLHEAAKPHVRSRATQVVVLDVD